METPSIEYLAGFFDGEGTVSMYRRSQGRSARVVVSVKCCCRTVLVCFHQRYTGAISPLASGTNKQMYRWDLYGREKVLAFLRSIQPFTIEKRPQIETAIEWLATRVVDPPTSPRPDHDPGETARCLEELKRLKTISY